MSNCSKTVIHSVYISSGHRDTDSYPNISDFSIDLPIVLNKIHGIKIRNYRYTPEFLISKSNQLSPLYTYSNGNQVNGTISIPKGDYNHSISSLLTTINASCISFDIEFIYNSILNRVLVQFIPTSSTYNTVHLPYSNLLKLLGFNSGIILYRSPDSVPNVSGDFLVGLDLFISSRAPRVNNDTNLILRVTDVETMHSTDSLTNRSTAVLMSSRNEFSTIQQYHDDYTPLLQVQHRLQRLRIQALNAYGELYDLNDENLTFQIDFYCYLESEM